MSSSFYHGFDTLHINWFTGCEPGLPCWDRCWARAMANRLKGRYGYPADDPFKPTFHEDVVRRSLPKKPKVIAMNFMGDWAFASGAHALWMIDEIDNHPEHTFLTLTKRPALLNEHLPWLRGYELPGNLWLGTSAATQAELDARLPALLRIPAAHYWLSLEPLLGPIDLAAALSLCSVEDDGSTPPWVNWVVVGCESGRGARWGESDTECGASLDTWAACKARDYPDCRKCEHVQWPVLDWTRSLVDQCRAAGVPCMVKQLPVFKDGQWSVSSDLEDFPPDLRVNERPAKKGGE